MSIPVVLLFAWHAMADNQGYPMGSPPYGLGFWINLAQTGTNGVSLGIPQSNAFNSNANAFGPNGNPMGPYGSSAGPNEGIGVFPTIQYGTASYRPGVCNLNVSSTDILSVEEKLSRNMSVVSGQPPFTTIAVCCKGYRLNNNACEPICEKGCTKGVCIRPNVCGCLQGYKLEMDGATCTPQCDSCSANTYCMLPNICGCLTGYQPNPVNRNMCLPVCEGGCPNGSCQAPGFCVCNLPYIKQNPSIPTSACVLPQYTGKYP